MNQETNRLGMCLGKLWRREESNRHLMKGHGPHQKVSGRTT